MNSYNRYAYVTTLEKKLMRMYDFINNCNFGSIEFYVPKRNSDSQSKW